MPGKAHRDDRSTSGGGALPPAGPGTGHVPALDGLRGLAILLVFVYHQTLLTGTTPLDRGCLTVARLGWCGVDLFFALSGFLITGILFDAKGGRGYFRNFYARRALRIFPLYYAVLFITLVLLPRVPYIHWQALRGAPGKEWWYWCYLSNFLVAGTGQWGSGALGVSWSLAIEEQFYLVWPLVVWFCGRRALLWTCAAVAAGSLLLRCGLLAGGASPVAVYVLTPTRCDTLALGAWVALAARGGTGLAGPRRLATALLPLAAAGLLALTLAGRTAYADPWMQTVGYSMLAVLAASAVAVAAAAPAGGVAYRLLTCRLLRGLGKYSYAIYLLHMPACALLREAVRAPGSFATLLGSQLPGQFAFYLGGAVLVCAAAWLSWHGFESPLLKLKKFFPAPGPAAAAPPPRPAGFLRDGRVKAPRGAGEPAPKARRPAPAPGR